MSEEKIRKNHTYKSCAESVLKKLVPKFIMTAAAALVFTFFCLFSHASLEELTNKYINVFSAFILFLVFVTGWIIYVVFTFLAYRMHKKRMMARGTQSGGKILKSEMVRKRGRHQYFFTVRTENGELFRSEPYNDDHFKNDECTECTVYSHDGDYLISEFIEVITHKDEKKDEKPEEKK